MDGFYQEATIEEQTHKLLPALRAAVRGADSASAGTKGVDGFYQEATIKEQTHKLSPALRASELVGTKGVDGFYQEATIKEQTHKLSPALRASGIKQVYCVWPMRHNLESKY